MFNDDDLIEDIDNDIVQNLMFLQIPSPSDDEEKIVEISFSKLTLKGGKKNYTIIQKAIPRLYRFKRSDTMVDIKRKIYESVKEAWKHEEGDEKINDEWICFNLFINFRNNSPVVGSSKYSRDRAKCEFCGDSHTANRELCEIRCKEFKNGNSHEEGDKFNLGDLYDQLEHKRDLIFDVGVMAISQADYAVFGLETEEAAKTRFEKGVELSACFREYCREEEIGGDD